MYIVIYIYSFEENSPLEKFVCLSDVGKLRQDFIISALIPKEISTNCEGTGRPVLKGLVQSKTEMFSKYALNNFGKL